LLAAVAVAVAAETLTAKPFKPLAAVVVAVDEVLTLQTLRAAQVGLAVLTHLAVPEVAVLILLPGLGGQVVRIQAQRQGLEALAADGVAQEQLVATRLALQLFIPPAQAGLAEALFQATQTSHG
jgi:hypothetical protein